MRMQQSIVSQVKVEKSLEKSIEQAVINIGGLQKFIQAGDRVFLKLNLNTADPFPASTALDFLQAVIHLVLKQNPAMIYLGDSCTFSQKTETVMAKKGIRSLEKISKKIKVIDFTQGKWVERKIPKGKYLKSVKLPEILDQVDRLIFLPCLKTHMMAQFTGSLKLAVGFIKPSQRLVLHLRNLQEKIADLNLVLYPSLVIMDARQCFITRGPQDGKIKKPNLILASESRVQMDIEGVKIIKQYPGNSLSNFDPVEITQIKRALALQII